MILYFLFWRYMQTLSMPTMNSTRYQAFVYKHIACCHYCVTALLLLYTFCCAIFVSHITRKHESNIRDKITARYLNRMVLSLCLVFKKGIGNKNVSVIILVVLYWNCKYLLPICFTFVYMKFPFYLNKSSHIINKNKSMVIVQYICGLVYGIIQKNNYD